MAKKTKMMFPKEKLEWLKGKLDKKHAAYNVTIVDENGHIEETQGDFHEDVNEFCEWIIEMINEIEWPQKPDTLTFVKQFDVTEIEFDHYLADEGIENKENCAPAWQELPMVTIFVPSAGQLIQISEGEGGTNLSREDREKGDVDYIYYAQFDLDCLDDEADGGQINKKEYLRDTYMSLEEAIPEVLELAYDDAKTPYILLKKET
ncbi:hypothetical protein bpr_II120 (plasmid) [Butyrivibrio proteoclasticus B316]|uniref:Uncharacterized protein n=1 Tax=Butyrivibrio proteoclasticus (strain ATCC 51982 / DSM 14932 / B316) TaxID=515622 RepID=E0S3S7_BUTPB|nr:hypothetical protein [Butyrivibrio proteoclasticus]ADL36059.1 hypothetical protein bpr_II120 [Butyrivibrio proteoclasticus B316]